MIEKFTDIMTAFDRMCRLYDSECDEAVCPIARLMLDWENEHNDIFNSSCLEFGRQYPQLFSEAIAEWNENHPEEVYPTIGDLLRKICYIQGINLDNFDMLQVLNTHINEKTASILNVKPIKEND